MLDAPSVDSPEVDLTGYATEEWAWNEFQPKGEYLTEVPAGYAKTADIPTKPEDIGAQPAGNYLTEVPSGYASEEFVTNKIAEAELGGKEVDLSGYAQKSELPTKVSQLENDKKYLTSYTETDPTVPSWAKNATKPSYSKSEVGLGNVDNVKQYSASNPPPYPVTSVNGKTGAVTVSVPTKVSQLQNDAGFLTEINKEEIVQQVLTVMGMHIVGVVDTNNNIVLTGKLTDGLYTLKYEDAEGNTVVIGTLDTSPSYTNLIPLSTEADGTPYNGGQGWKANTRLSSSGAESTTSATGMECTGFIPFKRGDVIRLHNIEMSHASTNNVRCYFIQYDSNKTMLAQWTVSGFNTHIDSGRVFTDADGNIIQINTGAIPSEEQADAVNPVYTNAAYFRISADEINADSIITINQEIPESDVPSSGANYTNQLAISTDADGNIYNGKGWKENTRISSSAGYTETTADGYYLTGFIKLAVGDVVRLKNLKIVEGTEYDGTFYVFDINKTGVGKSNTKYFAGNGGAPVWDDSGNLIQFTVTETFANWLTIGTEGYVRMGASLIDDTSIITINEEIV